VILLDIEMPRMDGFEFTKKIKADAKHARIPIVMITSRTAEKHRNLARELGVELYLGKPFQEDELLTHLREMLALTPRAPHQAAAARAVPPVFAHGRSLGPV
jgi:chemosensory pili system protein ChpA (sensor histidine kinase/response regulator)